MEVPVREWTHWAAGYGLPRASLKLLARQGDPLARLLRIGLQSLFEHFPQPTLAGEPTFNNSIGLHGLKHLPVSLRAAQPIRSTH